MLIRYVEQRQFVRPRPSRARVFMLARAALVLAGVLALSLILAPLPAAADGCTWQGPFICTDTLPNGTMGGSYSEQIPFWCTQAWCEIWLSGSSPPPGMTVSPSGLVTGGPLPTPGTFSFRVILCGHDHPACYVIDEKIMWLVVEGTNHQPTFTPGVSSLNLLEDDPPYSAIWATGISKGGPEDEGQTLTFRLSNNNHALFSVQPAIASDGTLTFTLAPDAYGAATVSVYLEDNGGIANGGINHSPTATFQIDVSPVDSVETGPVFPVNTTDWTTDHVCTEENCTLREAIEAANNFGGNNAGGPASTIELEPGAVYPIDGIDNTSSDNSPNGLPQILSNITINGHGASIRRSDTAPSTRLIDVGGGFLTLNEIALENGKAGPGMYSIVGGAVLDRGQLVIMNSYLANNSAEYGGAIFNPGGPSARIYNSTFFANSGGAIHSDGALDLYSNTFLDNTGGTASAVRAVSYTSYLKINLFNNLFASSNASVPLCDIAAGSGILAVGGNLAGDNSCAGSGVTTYAALKAITPPAYNDGPTRNIALQVGSSAIDAGNATACQNANIAGRDQRGQPRFIDGNGDSVAQCDIGAFEYRTPAPQVPPPPQPETDAPQVSLLLNPATPDGNNGWYRNPVTVQPQANDASTVIELRCALNPPVTPQTYDELPETLCPFLSGAQISTDGEHAFYAAAMDIWGNKSAVVSTALRIDATPPAITCPVDGPFLLHSGEHIVGPAGVDAAVSGLDEAASMLSSTITTDNVGPQTLAFTMFDLVGNSASQECSYAVIFDFDGFYPPVKPEPALNNARAGQTIPLKFSLAGDQGLAVIAAGYPASQDINCRTHQPVGELEPAERPGKSGLSYAAGNDWYHYGWQTQKAWSRTCRALVIQLIDGTEHVAYFTFR